MRDHDSNNKRLKNLWKETKNKQKSTCSFSNKEKILFCRQSGDDLNYIEHYN